jgi:hypothetical protein
MTTDTEKWLEVHRLLQQADRAGNLDQWSLMATFTRAAVWQLYELLEPPSARNIRQHQEDDE